MHSVKRALSDFLVNRRNYLRRGGKMEVSTLMSFCEWFNIEGPCHDHRAKFESLILKTIFLLMSFFDILFCINRRNRLRMTQCLVISPSNPFQKILKQKTAKGNYL